MKATAAVVALTVIAGAAGATYALTRTADEPVRVRFVSPAADTTTPTLEPTRQPVTATTTTATTASPTGTTAGSQPVASTTAGTVTTTHTAAQPSATSSTTTSAPTRDRNSPPPPIPGNGPHIAGTVTITPTP